MIQLYRLLDLESKVYTADIFNASSLSLLCFISHFVLFCCCALGCVLSLENVPYAASMDDILHHLELSPTYYR